MRFYWALEKLNTSDAVGRAIDLAFETNRAAAERKVSDLVDEAFPGLGVNRG
jgi:hypothetical protein